MRDSPLLGDHIKISQLSKNSRINLSSETSPMRDSPLLGDHLKYHYSSLTDI